MVQETLFGVSVGEKDEDSKSKKVEEKAEKCKFADEEGFFYLNNVKVNYKFKAEYMCMMPHFEFNTENKTPCLLTETGYRSDFTYPSLVNSFETLKESLIYEIDRIINCDDTGKKKKKQITYNLKFEDKELEKIKAESICPVIVVTKEEIEENKKAIINIEHRSDKSHLVSCSEFGILGLYSLDKEGKEKEEVEGMKKDLLKAGFKEENILIKEHTYVYQEDKPEEIEKCIKEHSEQLKKYLQKKYGYPVIIRVLKEGEQK